MIEVVLNGWLVDTAMVTLCFNLVVEFLYHLRRSSPFVTQQLQFENCIAYFVNIIFAFLTEKTLLMIWNSKITLRLEIPDVIYFW